MSRHSPVGGRHEPARLDPLCLGPRTHPRRRPLPPLGARRARRWPAPRRPRLPDVQGRRRLVRDRRRRRRAGRRLRLRPRRRHRRARPRLPRTGLRRARPVPPRRPRRLHLAPRLAGPPLARGGHLRAPRRHLHRGRHLPCRHRPASPPRRPRHHRGRADAGRPVRRHPRLGLRRRPALRAALGLRHARRPEGAGRRRPRHRPHGASSTSSTTTSAPTGTISAPTRPTSSTPSA